MDIEKLASDEKISQCMKIRKYYINVLDNIQVHKRKDW